MRLTHCVLRGDVTLVRRRGMSTPCLCVVADAAPSCMGPRTFSFLGLTFKDQFHTHTHTHRGAAPANPHAHRRREAAAYRIPWQSYRADASVRVCGARGGSVVHVWRAGEREGTRVREYESSAMQRA